MNTLTPEEARIILHKGTEAPFSGEYVHSTAEGVYVCRQCQAPLYLSTHKFASNCGWPSFDDAIPGAVLRKADADGQRVEILCASCQGHLGHVFEGEGFTAKNLRHCVNSLSMRLVPRQTALAATAPTQQNPAAPQDTTTRQDAQTTAPPAPALAYFAGGCFWGIEDAFSKVAGVSDVISGYMGGTSPNPTYDAVSTGRTGHAETVRVTYDATKVSFETLARLFFEIHDPTQIDRQGPDVGTQYRSALFYVDEAQHTTARHLVDLLQKQGWQVVTQLAPATHFYEAEDYHQDFTKRTGRGACHIRVDRFERKAPQR